MTTWVETTNIHQDGTPVTRKIKLTSYSDEVWFTENGYAEVADDVADILANEIWHISKVAEPTDPGTYYGDASNHESITLKVSDGTYDDLTSQSHQTDLLDGKKVGITDSQMSGRVGDYVYYDPANPGPYVDGEEAFADVPEGGTFLIAEGQYTVEDEGPLHSSIPRHIRGFGCSSDGSNISKGTQLRSEYTSDSVIKFTGDSTDTPEGMTMANLSVDQRADTTHPVIQITDITHTTIRDAKVGCAGYAGTGIQYSGKAFFARQYRNQIGGWTNRGISVEGTGYAHEFYQNFVSSSQGTDHTALYINTNRPLVMGGQYSAVGTGGCAIYLDADDEIKRAGGMIIEPGIERTEYPLRVGGAYNREGVYASFYTGHVGSDVVSILDLVNSNNGYYETTFSTAASGQLADYGTNSIGNTIALTGGHLEGMTVAGSPSNRDLIYVTTGVGNAQLPDFPTGDVRVYCPMNISENGPVWHDLSGWFVASSTSFTP